MTDDGPILLFDGVCNICDRSVQFVLDHDAAGAVRFASLQSRVGRELLAAHGVPPETDSVVLIADGQAHVRSDAALATAARLDAPWRWLAAARIVPRPVRDAVYDWIARNRTRWFGTREACRIPTPDVRARFLDAGEPAPAAAS